MPAPWRARRLDAAFVIEDANGVPLAYVYFAEGARLSAMPNALNEDEARRVAKAIARLPELLRPSP